MVIFFLILGGGSQKKHAVHLLLLHLLHQFLNQLQLTSHKVFPALPYIVRTRALVALLTGEKKNSKKKNKYNITIWCRFTQPQTLSVLARYTHTHTYIRPHCWYVGWNVNTLRTYCPKACQAKCQNVSAIRISVSPNSCFRRQYPAENKTITVYQCNYHHPVILTLSTAAAFAKLLPPFCCIFIMMEMFSINTTLHTGALALGEHFLPIRL